MSRHDASGGLRRRLRTWSRDWARGFSRGLPRCVAGLSIGAFALGFVASATAAESGKAAVKSQSATSSNSSEADAAPAAASAPKPKLDRTGKRRVGKASFYAQKFSGRKMADGARMDPHDDNAASKTLPLGTKAKVTNLETGKSAVVTIQDRGPYVDGRIVDLSPSTAQQIGITKDNGVAKVEVAPIVVPQPDGSAKPGAGAAEVAAGH